jgi:hypothetical protein
MCFSATASLASGLLVGGLGAATLPLVPERRQLPFAALPLLFGVHQLLEGVVWRQLDDAAGAALRTPAVVAWLVIAWTVVPVWVPLSASLFEPDRRRRRIMHGLTALGGVVGAFLLYVSSHDQVTVVIERHHLRYDFPLHPGWMVSATYVAATCLALVLSSHRFVVIFGVAMTAAMAVTTAMNAFAFSSVWCFFAALLSLGLFVHYRTARGETEPAVAMVRAS